MKASPFQVGDKVVLAYDDLAPCTTPKLVPGRVYCVGRVSLSKPSKLFPKPHQRLHLCGVRSHKRMRNPGYGLPFSVFRRVGDQTKEAA